MTSKQRETYRASIAWRYPDIAKMFLGKRLNFHHPDYTHLDNLLITFAGSVVARMGDHKAGQIDCVWFAASIKAAKFGLPVYHIAKEFAEAVDATNPPKDMCGYDLKLPFECFSVAMPLSMSRRLFKTDVSYIAILKMHDKEELTFRNRILENTGDKLCFMACCESTVGIPIQYSLVSRCNSSLADMYGPEYFTDFSEPIEEYIGELKSDLTKEEEQKLPQAVGVWCFKLLSVLNAAPQFLPPHPPAMHHKSIGNGKSSKPSRYSQPLWIGQGYVKQSEKPIGHHASPRMHWRRGHVRRQHHKVEGQDKIKTVWIEPVLVNKPKDE